MCVELLSRLPVRDLRAIRRIGALGARGGQEGEDDADDVGGGGGKGLEGMQAFDQGDGDGGGRGGDDDEEAERKMKFEAAKALKRKKIAVYRYSRIVTTRSFRSRMTHLHSIVGLTMLHLAPCLQGDLRHEVCRGH